MRWRGLCGACLARSRLQMGEFIFLRNSFLLAMQAVDAMTFIFGKQLRLRLQPLLHIMPRQGTPVKVIEIGPFSDLIRRWPGAGFVLALVNRRRCFAGRT